MEILNMKCPKCSTNIINNEKYCTVCAFNIKHFLEDKDATYYHALKLKKDEKYEESVEFFKISSRLKNSEAMYEYGLLFVKGLGVIPSSKNVIYCMTQSAKLGNEKAIVFLIEAHLSGAHSLPVDLNKAFELYNSLSLKTQKDNKHLLLYISKYINILKPVQQDDQNNKKSNLNINSNQITKKESELLNELNNNPLRKLSQKSTVFNSTNDNYDELLVTPIGEIINMKGTFNVVGFEEVVETNLDNSFNEENYNYEKLKESIDLKIKQLKLDIENIDLDDYVYMDDDSHYSDQMFKRGLVGRVNDEIKDLNDKKDKPYKFRMAILYPDDNLIEDVYIGNKDYMDITNNIKIFSWWSQLGNKVYDDINTEWIINGQIARLQLKRQIDIENGKLIDVSEIFNIKNGSTFNIVAKDEYLKKI